MMAPIKSIAVIGAGPAGAITVDALFQEKTFDEIKVFERQREAGGCWFASLPSHYESPLTLFAGFRTSLVTSNSYQTWRR